MQQNQTLERRDHELLSQTARTFFMAHHDALIGLSNRLQFHERLQTALEQQRRPNDGIALLCLDLDHFKQVNDTLGHPAGRCCTRQIQGEMALNPTPFRVFSDTPALMDKQESCCGWFGLVFGSGAV